MRAAVYSMSKFVNIYVALISGICNFPLPLVSYILAEIHIIWLLTGLMGKLIIELVRETCLLSWFFENI